MIHEIWGHKIDIPEPKVIGECYNCQEEIRDYEAAVDCEGGCSRQLHKHCGTICFHCEKININEPG